MFYFNSHYIFLISLPDFLKNLAFETIAFSLLFNTFKILFTIDT